MKKIIIFTILLLISICLFGIPYAKKCSTCIEYNKNGIAGIAHRDFSEPHIHKDGKIYAVYKCCYGHKVLVYLSDEN
jgi:hypothetical protein